MKLTHIANACCIYESNGYKILCDPWLTEGAFYGSWMHSHALMTKPQDVADYDLLYISHIHPDHFDPETLKHFDKSKPVLILNEYPNYLLKLVMKEGFTNIVMMEDEEKREFGPFEITMYGPFCGHPFFETQIGNPIDSAIVVTQGNQKIFNANDNNPSLEAARRLFNQWGSFDVAQLNYNNAGPYPACFNNLDLVGKFEESERLIDRNIKHVRDLCSILKPKYWQPFAGDYHLRGKGKTSLELGTLGTLESWQAGVRANVQKTIYLEEGYTFDLDTSEMTRPKFAYELESIPAQPEIDFLMSKARDHLRKKQEELDCFPDAIVLINDRYFIHMTRNIVADCENILKAQLDPGLLYWILTGKAHWNNAEIGCHIEFHREPNVYQPDVHLLLSFLHIPRDLQT